MTPEEGLKVYVYRTFPIIDKRDNEHFLAKISEPFDEDYLLRHFGSGKYFLRLNDNRGKTIASKAVSVHSPSHPPKVSPDEVVESDPRNEIYFKVWAKPAAPVSAGNGAPLPVSNDGASTAAISELGDIARALLDRQRQERPASKESALDPAVVNLWQDTAKQRDALAEKVASFASSSSPAVDLLDKVLGVVEKMNRNNPAAPPSKSTVEQLHEMVNLISTLKETFGPAETSPTAVFEDGSILRSVLNAVSPVLTQLAGPIGQAIAMKMMAVSGGAATAGSIMNPTAFATAPNPTSSPVPVGVGGMNAPVTPAGMPAASPGSASFGARQPENGSVRPAAESQPEGPDIAARAQLLQLAAQLGPLLLTALNQGCDGGAFAESLTTLYGGLAYEQIAVVGKEGIMESLQLQGQLWPQLAPIQARVEQFVEEFLEWGEAEAEEMDANQGTEPPAPTADEGVKMEPATQKRKKSAA
jgi:hypothetical protein